MIGFLATQEVRKSGIHFQKYLYQLDKLNSLNHENIRKTQWKGAGE